MTSSRDLFDASEKDAIRRAVEEAEGRTAGEIVPYVVGASDEYEGALWKGGVLGALAMALLAGLVRAWMALRWLAPPLLEEWGGGGMLLWLVAPPVIGAAGGMALSTFVPFFKRALVSAEVMDRRARRRAGMAFLEEEIFATRDRTGILIFLSLFEHRVVILGDSGINARVEAVDWQGIVDDLAAGIRAGRAADALVEAIGRCGELLERKGVEIRPDDTDELADDLRLKDR